MKEVKIEKCPFCGGEELFECVENSTSEVYISYKANVIGRDVRLYALMCRECGSVVRTYCKEPEKLFPKKERGL